jgi:predicted DNA-binding protein
MLVRNKKQVQKSFRIDEDVERDLGLLSQITGRSQNELANVALEELLQDNSIHFLNIVILEHYESEVENADEIAPFTLV